ncbi:MAG: NAD(P)-dependent oxidoreductase [Lachnospiraceae bacterium]|nr:NAD(P)-dependent oxidoreductase [Lachnospiraceae bacterium]
MKILVTGANGYLGMGVVKQLVKDGIDVIATDFCGSDVDERAYFIPADLFSISNPYEYFGEPDVLLHMAWRDGFVHNADSHIEDFPKHVAFVNKMIKSGVKRVAVMGSMHEIGFFEGCISEHTPCWPQSNYGIAKDALRKTTELYAKQEGIVFQWLRGYYIVGNTDRGCSIFSKIVKAEREGEKRFPFTMGQNQFDFIDYDLFCEQVAATVEQEEVSGIINICSGRPERLCDRVERFIHENQYEIKLAYGEFPDRPYDSKAVWGSSDKIVRIMSKYKKGL